MELMRVTYRLEPGVADPEARAEEIALEQTVEVPAAAVRDPFVQERIRGRVEAVETDGEDGSLVRVAYPAETTAGDPAQLLNVLFGNSSLHADIECRAAELPPSLLAAFPGPRFGIDGLRKEVGVYERPLTCTAVKPMGLGPGALADLFRVFARAGIDVIKDDHGLADHAFCPFEERLRACLAAAEQVADETGHRAVYAPNLIGTPGALARQLHFAQDHGARAVVVSPMLVGLPAFFELCQESSVPVLAHPAFGGAQRIAPELLFGRLLRLFGADAVIFVSYGSRFDVSQATCRAIVEGLAEPWSLLRPALPVVGGGITLENAAEVVRFYGRDAMLLIGGSLQVEEGAVESRSRAFVEAVRRAGAALGS